MKKLMSLLVLLLAFALVAPAQKKPADAAKKATAAAKTEVSKTLIDINSASEKDLQQLPGIGAAYSKKIIDGRPYGGKDELKKILPGPTYDGIKDLIVAKQAKKAAGAKK
jgi:competence protein ComEA